MEAQSNKKFKILFVSADRFPPFRVDVAVLFGKKIVERGHSIDWLLQSAETLRHGYQTQWSECKVFVGPCDNGNSFPSRVRKNINSLFHDLSMVRLVRNGAYDFVLVKDKFIPALLATIVSKLFGLPFVFWLSYPFPEDYLSQVKEKIARYPLLYYIKGHLLAFLLYRIVLPRSYHVFVQTEQMKKDVAEHGISMQKMTPVPMGVSTEEIPFFGYGSGHEQQRKSKIVLYLGTLIRVRKIDFVIRSFAAILRTEHDVVLYLVGGGDDPSDEQALKAEARRLGIEDYVHITGFLPQQQAWEHVKHADVCISPFYPTPILNSTSPTKLIEYMAMGKAVVANDHPEQSLVIAESKAGICVPYKEDAFAEAVVQLLKNPQLAREMGLRGRSYVVEHRNYDKLADLVEGKLLDLFGDGVD
jgi:glycosyltransferase involved in cell wall biosynthesis